MTPIDYDRASKTYDNTRQASQRLIECFAGRVKLDARTWVLDFGCGTGNYLDVVERMFGCRCCGVEPSDGMREVIRKKNPRVDVRQGDHERVPFGDGMFDFVYMVDVIHHVPDVGAMFKELWRVMRRGLLCVVTQSHGQIGERFYNHYFPSLANTERTRYPRIEVIEAAGERAGFAHLDNEVLAGEPVMVNEQFVCNVREKNYSMFRLLDEDEFTQGLELLMRDVGKVFQGAGETLVWFERSR